MSNIGILLFIYHIHEPIDKTILSIVDNGDCPSVHFSLFLISCSRCEVTWIKQRCSLPRHFPMFIYRSIEDSNQFSQVSKISVDMLLHETFSLWKRISRDRRSSSCFDVCRKERCFMFMTRLLLAAITCIITSRSVTIYMSASTMLLLICIFSECLTNRAAGSYWRRYARIQNEPRKWTKWSDRGCRWNVTIQRLLM